MKLSELKRLIKPIIRECINEVLAEQFLKTLGEQRQAPLPQAPAPKAQAPTGQDRAALRERLKEHLIDKADPMTELYEDSLVNTVPMQENATMDVSEAVMGKMGLFEKDYSKYL